MLETNENAESKDGGGYDYKRLHSYPLVRVNNWEFHFFGLLFMISVLGQEH